MSRQPELVCVLVQIGENLPIRQEEWSLRSMAEIAKAGQEAAGVSHHGWPNAARWTLNVPLATNVVRLFEDDWLEPVLF